MCGSVLKAANLAAAGVLYAPEDFKAAPIELLRFVCNGCGAKNSRFDFVPDSMWGLDVSATCHIHDWMYQEGTMHEDKLEADRVMLNNLLRLIERQDGWCQVMLKPLRRRRALKYYEAVVQFGGPAFWNGKELA